MKLLKIFLFSFISIILLITGAVLAYGTEQSLTFITKQLQFTTSASPTIVPTPTQTPTPTPTLTETPIPTPTQIVTKTPTSKPATPSATISPKKTPTPTVDEKLSIQAFDPPFIWADYATVGPKEAIVTGTGFTENTVFELYGPHDPYEKISSKDIIYPVAVVSVLSSHQVKVKIPVGLYNAHYSVKVTDPDKNTYVERDSILVVSGDTSINH